MRVIITSDIHFGVPGKLQHSIWAAKVIREYAAKNDIGVVLVLGDMFHDRQSLNIQVLSESFDFFDELDKDYDQEWVVFPGNHDMFLKNSWKVNSVRPLSRLLTIVEEIKCINIGGQKFWIVPFVHYEAAFMQAIRAIEVQASPDDILLTHIGVRGASLNECFLLKNWSVVDFSETKFKRVYTGHFHCYQHVGKNTWYPGSPIPFRFEEGLVEHGFLVYDTEKNEHEFINTFKVGKELLPNEQPSPDYLTFVDDDKDKVDVSGNYARVCLSKDYTTNELSEIRAYLLNKGAIDVKWMKSQQEEDLVIQEKSKITDGLKLFEQWVTHDNPEHLDKIALIDLNKKIVDEGEERISVIEDPDGESS
jgi:DNA repair exonuclease SbcCD nuclease subunit